MPIVDLTTPGIFDAVDTPKGFAVTPGKDDIDHGSEKPDFLSGAGAVFRQSNPLTSWLYAEDRASSPVQEPGFNPWDAIKGSKYEQNWNSFVEVRNSAAADNMKRKIDRETADHKMVDAMPFYQSFPVGLAAGILDPSVMLPGGAFVRGTKGGFSIAKTAASVAAGGGLQAAVEEAALHSSQETRTLGESAMNIGASVVLGGLLGAGGAKLLSHAEWTGAVASLNRELAGGADIVERAKPVIETLQRLEADAGNLSEKAQQAVDKFGKESPEATAAFDAVDANRAAQAAANDNLKEIQLNSVGAAATGVTSISGNTIAGKVANALAEATRRLNPALRLNTSPSPVTREEAGKLFEFSGYLDKNAAGVASEQAVETLMKEWNAGLSKAVIATDEAFSGYSKGGGAMPRTEFREAVGKAMRRGDEDADPFVANVAKAWRSQVFDPLKEAAIKAKLLPEDVSVETAASYFSRMWNVNKLNGQEGLFKSIVTKYYADAIGKEYQKSTQNFTQRMARLDQEAADLNIPADARGKALDALETAAQEHESQWPSLSEAADRLSEIRSEMRAARKANDEAAQSKLKSEAETIKANFTGDSLLAFTAKRSELASRRRHVDLGTVGLQERSDRVLSQLADLEETNQRAMERLVSKGQKLERDLDRLDADALDARVTQLSDQYAALARKSEAAATRAEQAIANMKQAGESGAERNRLTAEKAATEALTGPPEEVAAKRAAAHEAAQKTAEKRAAADAKIQKRLEKEIETQRARAERMDDVARRLETAKNFDHDGLMDQIKGAIDKATRETSAQSLARGERAARLGERMAALDPARIAQRVKTIDTMKREAERSFYDRWEIKNLGQGVDPALGAKADFTDTARAIADSAFATLTGRVDGGLRPEFLKITSRGPMKDRTLNIPDKLIEDFLEHDVDLVGRRYTRVMGADVELANKFGSVDMADQLNRVRSDYARLRAGVSDEKRLAQLGEAEKADIRDLEAVRDLLRGTRMESPIERNYSKIVRSFSHVNYLRQMGEVALMSLSETVRPAMVHGLMPYLGTVAKLATNLGAIKLSVAEAKLAGNVSERVLGHRLATIADLTDPYASRGPIEAFLENMTNFASKWNGIRMLTDMQKSIASVMTQDRILAGSIDHTSIKPKERAYLAYLGIDESMAGRVAKQFSEHGETVEGVKVANTEQWSDPVAVRAYRAAMNKDVDSIITTKGVADVPLFASTSTGKAMLQFKSFFLASHQRVLLRGLQEDQARFIGGTLAMTGIGMFVTYLKALSGNRQEKLADFAANPGWWVSEGLDKAGIFSVPMELANTIEKATGFNAIKSPMKAFDEGNRQSQRNQNRSVMGTIAGPSAGLIDDASSVAGIPHQMWKGEDITQGQKNAAERLIPFNSYAGVRQILRYVVNPQP